MSADRPSAVIDPADCGFDRLLLFELQQTQYALAVSGVSGLAPMGPLRTVPRTHEAVLGLTEWRGNALTVIDLPRLLGVGSIPGNDCLIRLASPWHRTALRIPATVRLASREQRMPADSEPRPGVFEGKTVQFLDIPTLVRSVEAKIRDGG